MNKKALIPIILLLLTLPLIKIFISPSINTTGAKEVVIQVTPGSQTKTILFGPKPYWVTNGKTYVLFYDYIESITKEYYSSHSIYAQLKNPKNFKYCTKYNGVAEFVSSCGNCMNFFLLNAPAPPATAVLLVNDNYAHVMILNKGYITDAWITIKADEYLSNYEYENSPIVIYLITLLPNRNIIVTTTNVRPSNNDGVYMWNGTVMVKSGMNIIYDGTPILYSDPLNCKNFTTIIGNNIILGCSTYSITPFFSISGTTYYTNKTLGKITKHNYYSSKK